MNLKNFLIFSLSILIGFSSCSDKYNAASITKTFEGKTCELFASSSRDVSWVGGPGARVLPIAFPNSDEVFVTNVIIDGKDTINLEYDTDIYTVLDSIEIVKYLESVQLSFTPSYEHIWFSRKHESLDPSNYSIIIHKLNNEFTFYTHVPNKKPIWKNIKSPKFYFNQLIIDTAKTKKQSRIIWTYIGSKDQPDSNDYKAFLFWHKDRDATNLIYDRCQYWADKKPDQAWIKRTHKLIKDEHDKLYRKEKLSENDRDNILSLSILLSNVPDEKSFKLLSTLVEPHFLSSHKNRELYFRIIDEYYDGIRDRNFPKYYGNGSKDSNGNEIKVENFKVYRNYMTIKQNQQSRIVNRAKSTVGIKEFIDNILTVQQNFKDDTILNKYCMRVLVDSLSTNKTAYNELLRIINGYDRKKEEDKKIIYNLLVPLQNSHKDSLARALLTELNETR